MLSVNLAGFNPSTSSPNWIKVDDNSTHLEDSGFGQTFRKTYRASPAGDHVFHMWVWSNDDPNWQYGRSFYAEYRVAVCAPAAPPPTPAVTQPTSRPATTTPRRAAVEGVAPASSPSPSAEPTPVTTSTDGSMMPISVPSSDSAYQVMPAAVSDVQKSSDMWILPLIIGMMLLAGGLTVLLLLRRRTDYTHSRRPR